MKFNTKKTISAALAGTMVLSLSIPVFASVGNETGIPVLEQAEKKAEDVIFWNARTGLDSNTGLKKDAAVKSLKKAAELAEKEADSPAMIVICQETALTKEESSFLEKNKLNAVSLSDYEEMTAKDKLDDEDAAKKAVPDKDAEVSKEAGTVVDADAADSTVGAPAETKAAEGAAIMAETAAAEDAVQAENPAVSEDMADTAAGTEEENIPKTGETVIAETNAAGAELAAASLPEGMSENDIAEGAAAEAATELANSQNSLNNPGETLLPAPPDNVSPIPPMTAEASEEGDEEVLLLSTADVVMEMAPAPVQAIQINETVAVSPAETAATEGAAVSEVTLMTLPGRDVVGTGTTKTTTPAVPSAPGSGSSGSGSSAAGGQSGKGNAGTSVTPANPATGSTTPVNTADELVYLPYLLCAVLSGTALVLVNKLNLDSKRKFKSSVYAEEMESFRKACTMD